MSEKPVIARRTAVEDVRNAMDYYTDEAELDVAFRFSDAVGEAYAAIARHPGIGSLQYSDASALAGLRTRAVKRFPYLLFYIEHADRIDVWRVLHAQRDIPVSLGDAISLE